MLQKGDQFLQRYYTRSERDYLAQRGKMLGQSAAGLFAAKEAALKAFGCGLSGGIALSEVEIGHDALGAPCYTFLGAAQKRLAAMGAKGALLSITHDGDMAAAVCIIE